MSLCLSLSHAPSLSVSHSLNPPYTHSLFLAACLSHFLSISLSPYCTYLTHRRSLGVFISNLIIPAERASRDLLVGEVKNILLTYISGEYSRADNIVLVLRVFHSLSLSLTHSLFFSHSFSLSLSLSLSHSLSLPLSLRTDNIMFVRCISVSLSFR